MRATSLKYSSTIGAFSSSSFKSAGKLTKVKSDGFKTLESNKVKIV